MSGSDRMFRAWQATLVMQIQGSALIVERLAIQCWGSRRTWKFGENPARSRHCVSWDELHCLETALPRSSQTLPPTSSVNAGRRNPEEELMSDVTHTKPVAVAAPPFSFTQVLPWLIFAAMLLLVAMYFISAEQGANSLLSGTGVHEWVHDGRHLLGFPCH
jgi:hypothetical protein